MYKMQYGIYIKINNKKIMWRVTITAAVIGAVAILNVGMPEKIIVNNIDYPKKEIESGIASWYNYSLGYENQKCTKDRMPCYSQLNNTCASKKYPRGTMLRVSYKLNNLDNEVICRVNDYGPEMDWRIIDLSSHAFEQLAPLEWGLIRVEIEKI